MTLCLQANQPQQNKINCNAKQPEAKDQGANNANQFSSAVNLSFARACQKLCFSSNRSTFHPCHSCLVRSWGPVACAGGYLLLCFPTMKKSARVQPANFTVSAAASLHPRFIGMWCHLFFFVACSANTAKGRGRFTNRKRSASESGALMGRKM